MGAALVRGFFIHRARADYDPQVAVAAIGFSSVTEPFSLWQAPVVMPEEANALLERFRKGEIDSKQVLRRFQTQPLADLGFAQVDTHRSLRKGFPEVIFGAGKSPEHVVKIARKIWEHDRHILVTRITSDHAKALQKRFKSACHSQSAGCVTIQDRPLPKRPGVVAVLTAGTSDLPIAEEAAITADIMGNDVLRIYDVGIAGIHRLLARLDDIQTANVLIVVAGMEGALPSAVAGLVCRPVIAVPTSVGYGASLGGIAALLGMLNSCGSGVTVVNIDNGFGAAYAASQINALAADSSLATAQPVAPRNRLAPASSAPKNQRKRSRQRRGAGR